MPTSSSSSSSSSGAQRRRRSNDRSETAAPATRARSTSRKRKATSARRSAIQHAAGNTITITEYLSQPHIASKPINTYTLHNNHITANTDHRADTSATSSVLASLSVSSLPSHVVSFLSSLFLPVNYPHSVTPDYLSFQLYDTLQASSSYLRGLLCTQAILAGIGVGSTTATPASATLNWITRDGVGMLGGMLFAW